MIQKKYNTTIYFLTFALTVYLLFNPQKIMYYSKQALQLCAHTLIPSVFIFIILSRILSHLCEKGAFDGKATRFLSKIFHVPQCLIYVCLVGFFTSAPSGAFAISKLYSDSLCTKQEAEKACILCNSASASFILSVAGALSTSLKTGLIILLSNTLSTLIIYFLLFRGEKVSENCTYTKVQQTPISDIICESIISGTELSLKICGFVLFFSVLGSVFTDILFQFSPDFGNSNLLTKGFILSIFEMTSGIITMGKSYGYEKVLMISSAVAFCGLSVMFQVKSVFSKVGLSSSSYFLSKIISFFLTPIIVLILLFFLPQSALVFGVIRTKSTTGFSLEDLVSMVIITLLFFVGAAILKSIDKKHKN